MQNCGKAVFPVYLRHRFAFCPLRSVMVWVITHVTLMSFTFLIGNPPLESVLAIMLPLRYGEFASMRKYWTSGFLLITPGWWVATSTPPTAFCSGYDVPTCGSFRKSAKIFNVWVVWVGIVSEFQNDQLPFDSLVNAKPLKILATAASNCADRNWIMMDVRLFFPS